jgi:hypothetical protein
MPRHSSRSGSMLRSISSLRAAGFLAAVVATGAGAQQPAGRMFNPRVNPADPDIVAFERLEGDLLELQLRRLSTGEVVSVRRPAAPTVTDGIGLPDAADGRALSLFSGDLDWRPPTNDGKLWFAYVASDARGLSLLVNYVERSRALAPGEPLRIPLSGNARRPRWSPDGNSIAFVSDSSVLHIIWNVADALSSASPQGLRATRVVQAGVPALFPAWSPRGDQIAYQVEKTIRGVRRFAIDVIAVDSRSAAISGAPITVTEALDESAFRPSWSPDARYLAFYSSRIAQETGESRAMDIGIVELQVSPSTGRLFRGQPVQGRSRRIAENVIPSDARGPEWTRLSMGGQPELAVAFVQLDQARNNPIAFAGLRPWLDMRGRTDYETNAPAVWATVNHKDLSATEIDGAVRYTYVSVAGGGEAVQYRDAAATWAKGAVTPPKPEPVVAVTPPSPTAAPAAVPPAPRQRTVREPGGNRLALALLFPGGAQWASGRKGKATAFTLAALGGAAIGWLGVSGTKSAADRAASANALGNREAYNAASADHGSKKTVAMLGGGALGAAWLLGVIDAAMAPRMNARHVSLDIVPAGSGDRSAQPQARFGMRLPFGGPGREER